MTLDESKDLDERAAWEASNSAQAESEAQAEYENSLHKNCFDKSVVAAVIKDFKAKISVLAPSLGQEQAIAILESLEKELGCNEQ